MGGGVGELGGVHGVTVGDDAVEGSAGLWPELPDRPDQPVDLGASNDQEHFVLVGRDLAVGSSWR
jgi:hypothetical protein